VHCPQCRQTVVEGARFCSQCGSAVAPSTCTSCAVALPAHARFCPGCGTAVTGVVAPPPAAPPPAAPPPAAPPPVTRAPIEAPPRVTASDPAEALLAARDPDGTPDDEPSAEDLELLRRMQDDRARTRSRRRSVAIMVVALIVLVAAVAYSRRSGDEAATATPSDMTVADANDSSTQASRPVSGRPASESPRDVDTARAVADEPKPPARPQPDRTATPAPRPSRAEAQRAERAERAERARTERAERARSVRIATRDRVPDPARNTAPATEAPRAGDAAPAERSIELPPRAEANASSAALPATDVAATPPAAAAPAPAATRRPATPDVRVEVAQKRDGANGAVDYTVRLSNPTGEPVTGADVRLRGVTTDGLVVEAPLEPAGTPGLYHGLVAFSDRGPRGLTLRIARASGVLEVPVSGSAAASSSIPR